MKHIVWMSSFFISIIITCPEYDSGLQYLHPVFHCLHFFQSTLPCFFFPYRMANKIFGFVALLLTLNCSLIKTIVWESVWINNVVKNQINVIAYLLTDFGLRFLSQSSLQHYIWFDNIQVCSTLYVYWRISGHFYTHSHLPIRTHFLPNALSCLNEWRPLIKLQAITRSTTMLNRSKDTMILVLFTLHKCFHPYFQEQTKMMIDCISGDCIVMKMLLFRRR